MRRSGQRERRSSAFARREATAPSPYEARADGRVRPLTGVPSASGTERVVERGRSSLRGEVMANETDACGKGSSWNLNQHIAQFAIGSLGRRIRASSSWRAGLDMT